MSPQRPIAAPSSPAAGPRRSRAFMPRRRNVDLAEQAGQTLIVSLAGPSLSEAERAWLQKIRPGGLILFRRNIEEASRPATSSAWPIASGRRPSSAASILKAASSTVCAT